MADMKILIDISAIMYECVKERQTDGQRHRDTETETDRQTETERDRDTQREPYIPIKLPRPKKKYIYEIIKALLLRFLSNQFVFLKYT